MLLSPQAVSNLRHLGGQLAITISPADSVAWYGPFLVTCEVEIRPAR